MTSSPDMRGSSRLQAAVECYRRRRQTPVTVTSLAHTLCVGGPVTINKHRWTSAYIKANRSCVKAPDKLFRDRVITGIRGRQPTIDVSHKPSSRCHYFSARPTVTFPASKRPRPWAVSIHTA